MIIVGLVGRMAAGKSTVARLFAGLGARVLDADAIAHDALDEAELREAVVARFGAGVVGADGRVSRRALAGIVFGSDPAAAAALADLESLVHPRVRQRMEVVLETLRRAEPHAGRTVVVLDVPLLVQAGWAAACDRIVLVECDEAERRRRLAARGIAPEQQAARDRAWDRAGDPRAVAPGKTVVVDASRDEAYTRNQVAAIWTTLTH